MERAAIAAQIAGQSRHDRPGARGSQHRAKRARDAVDLEAMRGSFVVKLVRVLEIYPPMGKFWEGSRDSKKQECI